MARIPIAEGRRERFLADLAPVADREFGGRVERPFATALYTARRTDAPPPRS